MKKIVLALFVMFAFIIVACTGMKQSLKGKEFIYQKTAPSSEITLGFDTQGNRVYGSSGVNRYFGNYTQKGNQLQFGPLASTMMAGPQ